MDLEPYQQRVVEEKRQLDERLSALTVFLLDGRARNLPRHEYNLLEAQLSAMTSYSDILAQRIDLFHTEHSH